MGLGKKGKGKGDGEDDDLPKGLRRKPGESGEDLVKRLEKRVASSGKQICGTCGGTKEVGSGGAQITPQGKQRGGFPKPCSCNDGWRRGRVR